MVGMEDEQNEWCGLISKLSAFVCITVDNSTNVCIVRRKGEIKLTQSYFMSLPSFYLSLLPCILIFFRAITVAKYCAKETDTKLMSAL